MIEPAFQRPSTDAATRVHHSSIAQRTPVRDVGVDDLTIETVHKYLSRLMRVRIPALALQRNMGSTTASGIDHRQ
ncbi:hypothetical protein [Bradyrhizobium sp. WSM3983]|uniref:hypothetical protein n=1 Tax=Bradyrhizobium sp. WSM3983 TaxID=1038867 RepID=UPI0012EB714F|nr:hypothetical protein [Bradyrhizobium sp. WSM3983]